MDFQHMLTRRQALLRAGVAAVALPTLFGTPSRAQVKVDINRPGDFQPITIAIPDLLGDPQLGKELVEIISNNLRRCGYFNVLPQQAYLERITSIDTVPNFANWRSINAQMLAVGTISRGGQGLVAQYRLFDVLSGEQRDGKQFTTTAENTRRLGHILSDAIYSAVTGLGGYFDSRVAFVDESGSKQKRNKRISIMDQDGANLRYLTAGGQLVITPRFSPRNNQLVYMQFGGEEPRVYLLDLQSGSRQNLGSFPGISFAPRFSPDGGRVVMSIVNQDGNASLAMMDLGSRNISRVTSGPQIDTGASFSPDGQRIVFESDRGGGQQLYVISPGGGPQRISFGQGNYSTPVWSPRGDLIAFTKQASGSFSLGVIRPDGQGERILTTDFHCEGPTFSPNGQVIMFFKEKGPGPKLYSIDVTGRFEQTVPSPNFASDPAWGPLLA